MKKLLFVLTTGAVLLTGGLVRAQAPAPAMPANAPTVMVLPAAGNGCGSGCCPSTCCPAQTTCVPEQYTKKVPHTVYSSVCEPVCLCYFHNCLSRGCCDSGHCERPYTRKFLVKKVHTCEECATRCVPSQASCGTSGCCGATAGCGGSSVPQMMPAAAPPAGVVPVAPPQQMPKGSR